jgi:hypothetical protein
MNFVERCLDEFLPAEAGFTVITSSRSMSASTSLTAVSGVAGSPPRLLGSRAADLIELPL